jgi:hypothetical protein
VNAKGTAPGTVGGDLNNHFDDWKVQPVPLKSPPTSREAAVPSGVDGKLGVKAKTFEVEPNGFSTATFTPLTARSVG